MGLVVLSHVGSSQTRAQTHVPCIGRQILNHCTTREVPLPLIFNHNMKGIFDLIRTFFKIDQTSPQILLHINKTYSHHSYFITSIFSTVAKPVIARSAELRCVDSRRWFLWWYLGMLASEALQMMKKARSQGEFYQPQRCHSFDLSLGEFLWRRCWRLVHFAFLLQVLGSYIEAFCCSISW